MRELRIAAQRIADDTDAFVIAEVGTNHGGSVETATRLIEAAAQAGADAVKLQKRDNATLFTRALYDAHYHSEHAFGATYGAHREALELSEREYVQLRDCAWDLGLAFGATAFDQPSAAFLDALDVDFIKIASGDLTNTPLIRHIVGFGRPAILSTGGGTGRDVDRAWRETRGWDAALLQCTAAYPCLPAEMNLRVIERYREEYPDTVIGLSDHQDGISLAPVAYALGARIFEKHFTLSRSAKGSDHAFSLEPLDLRRLVLSLRETREALGDGVKRVCPSEEGPLYKMAKSVVAARDLPAGHVLTAGDLACKSPGGGLPPYAIPDLVHQRLSRAVAADEAITREAVQPWD